MTTPIDVTNIKLNYVSIAEAKQMSGLRLVLGAYAIPGPWRESCKSIFYVKKISYTAVVTSDEGRSDLEFGQDGADSELKAWTGQSSAPVAIWNDERPRISWIDQINLAERLEPNPPLIPEKASDRALMFGLINELAGEGGFVWMKRIALVHKYLEETPHDDPSYKFWQFVGEKYGYTPQRGEAAPSKIAENIAVICDQLAAQEAAGHQYLIGDRLSALDIYWSCFAGVLDPMPADLCPMATAWRDYYNNPDPEVQAAINPAMLEHRDFIYREFLELPIVF